MPNFVKIGQLSVFVNIFLVGSMMGPQRRKGLGSFLYAKYIISYTLLTNFAACMQWNFNIGY